MCSFVLVSLIVTVLASSINGKAQYQDLRPYVFGSYPVVHPMMARHQQDGRFFFGVFTTVTLTVTTSTTTTTSTATTTCTTSTTTLSTCTPGRRRRDTDDDMRNPRGLFYAEKEEEEKDGSIFLPPSQK